MPSALRTPTVFGCVLAALATAFVFRKDLIDFWPLQQTIMPEDSEGKELLLAKIQEERSKYFKK